MKPATLKLRKQQNQVRLIWSRALRDALEEVRCRGISAEQIAVDLKVTKATVMLWMTGERCPKYPVIKHVEHKYGVKIIEENAA